MAQTAVAEIPQNRVLGNGFKVPVLSSTKYDGNAEARIDVQVIPYIVYNLINIAKLPELFPNFCVLPRVCSYIPRTRKLWIDER